VTPTTSVRDDRGEDG